MRDFIFGGGEECIFFRSRPVSRSLPIYEVLTVSIVEPVSK